MVTTVLRDSLGTPNSPWTTHPPSAGGRVIGGAIWLRRRFGDYTAMADRMPIDGDAHTVNLFGVFVMDSEIWGKSAGLTAALERIEGALPPVEQAG